MLTKTIKTLGSVAKAASSKSVPDIVRAGSETVGLVKKMAKKKKPEEKKRPRTKTARG